MSQASFDVMQQQDKDAPLTWEAYEGLRDHLTDLITKSGDHVDLNMQAVQMKVDGTAATITTMQTQMTALEASIEQLKTSVTGLRNALDQRQLGGHDDDGSFHGDNDNLRVNPGRGRGGQGQFRQPNFGLGARRLPIQDDDILSKPKFSIPKFEGSTDVEDYLTWELKMEKIWRLTDYSEDRNIKLASSEFDGYALRWWDSVLTEIQETGGQPIRTWCDMKAIMKARFVPTNYLRTIYDKLQQLKQGTMSVDAYYMEMELLLQRARIREEVEQTMQCFLHGLKFTIKSIVRHHAYYNMNDLLHLAREAESQLAEEAQMKSRYAPSSRFSPRTPSAPMESPSTSNRSPPSYSRQASNGSMAKKLAAPAASAGSNMSTARNKEVTCHACGNPGHFKRDCPNRKVMFVNEDTGEYETGDDEDPDAYDNEGYNSELGMDAFPSRAPTIVVSQRALTVQPHVESQRCNLFQTKALVGPNKACKVIIDGGSCRNLASKELCAKLNLKYLPHPNPYFVQWLSESGEMKVNHMVRVNFEIGPYKDSIDFDVVPMTVCHLLLGRPWLYDSHVQHNGRANTYHLEFKGKKIDLHPMSPQQIVNESRQKIEVNLQDAPRRESVEPVSVVNEPQKNDKTKSERVPNLVILAT